MCMEDIRIGRKTLSAETQVSVATTTTPLVGPSPMRIGLAIYPVATDTINVSTNPGVVPTNGIRINDATHALIMTLETHGNLVQKGWSAAMTTAGAVVTITEVMFNGE